MTGLPEFNYPAFRTASRRLRKSGYSVLSPHEKFDNEISTGSAERPWWEYMTDGLRSLMYCTDIILLLGWESSVGANLEKTVAEGLGMGVYLYKEQESRPVLHILKRGKRDVHDGEH